MIRYFIVLLYILGLLSLVVAGFVYYVALGFIDLGACLLGTSLLLAFELNSIEK